MGKSEVGTPGVEGAVLLEEGKLFEQYDALLHSKTAEGDIKSTVADLESRTASLKSNIQLLENQVRGNAPLEASLLTIDATGSSLASRTVALEKEVAIMRTKVSSLEQTVAGF